MKWWIIRIGMIILFLISVLGILFNFLEILQRLSPKITEITTKPEAFLIELSLSVVSFYMFIHNEINEVKENLKKSHNKIHETIFSIKGVLPTGEETDVVRKVLEMEVGENIAKIILPRASSFPITLVPGGDVALIISQKEYGKMIERLLTYIRDSKDYRIYWTTFVPFESLNKNLSGYTEEQWQERITKGSLNFTPSDNANFYNYVSQWRNLEDRGKQVIILHTGKVDNPTNSQGVHPMNCYKYAKDGLCNLDIIKYLLVRYSIESELSEFTNRYEGYFTETEIKKRVIERDNNYKNVKWISLEEVKSIVNEMQTRYSHGIHNIDFIYFEKPGNDFVLVRVDADNNFSVGNGVIGVTFIVFTSRSIKVYFELFKKMFNKAEQTFAGLTKTSL
jgi:hypothetical protein